MDGVGEIRNILLLLSKRLEALERRLSDVSVVANGARARGDVANQLIFNERNRIQHDHEIQLIRKLFGGSGPTLGDMLPEISDKFEEYDLLGVLTEIMDESELDPTSDTVTAVVKDTNTPPVTVTDTESKDKLSPDIEKSLRGIDTTSPPNVTTNQPPTPLQ